MGGLALPRQGVARTPVNVPGSVRPTLAPFSLIEILQGLTGVVKRICPHFRRKKRWYLWTFSFLPGVLKLHRRYSRSVPFPLRPCQAIEQAFRGHQQSSPCSGLVRLRLALALGSGCGSGAGAFASSLPGAGVSWSQASKAVRLNLQLLPTLRQGTSPARQSCNNVARATLSKRAASSLVKTSSSLVVMLCTSVCLAMNVQVKKSQVK